MPPLKADVGPSQLIAKVGGKSFGQDIEGVRINTEAMDAITTEAGDNIVTNFINVLLPTFRIKGRSVRAFIAKT